jgi:hypothetical protein
VWGLARTDEEWSTALEAALTASRRDDLKHGTTPAYVHGGVCKECRDHQQWRMGGAVDSRRCRAAGHAWEYLIVIFGGLNRNLYNVLLKFWNWRQAIGQPLPSQSSFLNSLTGLASACHSTAFWR